MLYSIVSFFLTSLSLGIEMQERKMCDTFRTLRYPVIYLYCENGENFINRKYNWTHGRRRGELVRRLLQAGFRKKKKSNLKKNEI